MAHATCLTLYSLIRFILPLTVALAVTVAASARAERADICQIDYALIEGSAHNRLAHELLRSIGFYQTLYMNDLIWHLKHDPRFAGLSGRQKAAIWRVATSHVRQKQSYYSYELPFQLQGIRATAFLGTIATDNIRSIILFVDLPTDGAILHITSLPRIAELVERGMDATSGLTRLSESERSELIQLIGTRIEQHRNMVRQN